MKEIKELFETSTIHGVYFISSTRKLARLFWLSVVLSGFIGAGYLIWKSFDNWNRNPIITTTETLPISALNFPKVAICPQKGTYTNLNYDLVQMQENEVGITEDNRKEFLNVALEMTEDKLNSEVMKDFDKVQENNRFYNWYYGYTEMKYPYYDGAKDLHFEISTSADSGSIATQNFGEKYVAELIEPKLDIKIKVVANYWMNSANINETLYFTIDKMTKNEFANDVMDIEYEVIDSELTHYIKSIFKPKDYKEIHYHRRVTSDWNIEMSKLKTMPGFQLKWHYDKSIAWTYVEYTIQNRHFVRYT